MNRSRTSTLLTIIGAIGVVATAVTAVKNTPKAQYLIQKAEYEKDEELTTLEKVKAAAPAYIPTAIVAGSTIACVLGSNILNKQTQASMASAYALLDASYKEYRRKVIDIYGENADSEVLEQLAKDDYEEEVIDDLPDGELLFWDSNSGKYFTGTIEDVLQKTDLGDGMECYIISTPFDIPMSYWWGRS